MSKIIEGAKQAELHAKTFAHVCDWIREDAPMSLKMAITPDLVNKLVDRIAGTKTRTAE